jgi:predicted transcriptional regulator
MEPFLKERLEKIKSNITAHNQEILDTASKYEAPKYLSGEKLITELNGLSLDDVDRNLSKVLHLHENIIPNAQKEKDILRYYMRSRKVPDSEAIDSLDKAKSTIPKLLSLFHQKVGGFNLEDNIWNMHDSSSKLFRVRSGTLLFSNSFRRKLANDVHTLRFINELSQCISKYLTENMSVTWKKIFDERKEIFWALIVIRDENELSDESDDENDKEDTLQIDQSNIDDLMEEIENTEKKLSEDPESDTVDTIKKVVMANASNVE